MIAVVIYGIIAIALASIAGYSIISFFDASRTMSRASENLSRMDMAINLVKANIRYVDGEPVVPLGTTQTGSYDILPSWMSAYDVSTTGDRYLYCPFGSSTRTLGSNENISDGDGSTYSVSIVQNSETAGQAYVYGNTTSSETLLSNAGLSNAGILAFLISPTESNGSIPNCADVTLSANGNFLVSGGVVKVIQKGTISSQRNILSSSKAIFYVSPTGTGDGRDFANATTLDSALSFMAIHTPRVMEIHMTAGAYSGTALETFVEGADSLGESKLMLIGDGGTSSTVNITMSSGVFDVPVNVYLRDVNLDADIEVKAGRKLFIDNDVKVESITLLGGELYLNNNDTELDVSGSNDNSAGISLYYGSKLTSVAEVGSENRIYFSGSPTSGIDSKGVVNLLNTDIEFANVASYGIFIGQGASLNMDNVDIASSGAKPTYGVFDDGATSVAGNSGTDIYASSSCWNVDDATLFEYSTGASSYPIELTNTSWADATYSATTESNTDQYVESRAVQYANKSEWTCHN